jgi:hypothetical protein
MESEQNKTRSEDFAEVWRNAEQRRAEDIGGWLNSFFEQRRHLKAAKTESAFPQANPILR